MGVPRKSAKAAKTGLDARPGPKTWERPSDCFKELRAAPGWLPRTPAGARVPTLSRCQSCQIPEIRNVLRIYMGRRPRRLVRGAAPGPFAAQIRTAPLKDIKRVVQAAKTPAQRRVQTASSSAEDPRAAHVEQPTTAAHDGPRDRARVGLPPPCTAIEQRQPWTPSSKHVETPPPPHPKQSSAARLQVQRVLRQRDKYSSKRRETRSRWRVGRRVGRAWWGVGAELCAD